MRRLPTSQVAKCLIETKTVCSSGMFSSSILTEKFYGLEIVLACVTIGLSLTLINMPLLITKHPTWIASLKYVLCFQCIQIRNTAAASSVAWQNVHRSIMVHVLLAKPGEGRLASHHHCIQRLVAPSMPFLTYVADSGSADVTLSLALNNVQFTSFCCMSMYLILTTDLRYVHQLIQKQVFLQN